MTFSELIKAQSWPSVEATLMMYFSKYQSSLSGFKRAFNMLQNMEPQQNADTLKLVRIDAENVDVTTVCDGKEYSITIAPWNEILGNRIDAQSFAKFSQPEIAVFVLWQLTFYGFDEETIRKKTDEWLKNLK
ncbi:MAG: hypothetical protein IKN94_04815 [Salinivirgaceae bacterium]|nr:hypothetical protein [Salinivirgaceae bacterium]